MSDSTGHAAQTRSVPAGFTGAPGAQPRRRLPRPLLALLLVLALLAAGIALAWHGMAQVTLPPVSVVIDGDEVLSGVDLGALTIGEQACVAGGVVLAILAVAVVVPLTLLVAAAVVATVLLVVAGVPVLVAGVLLAVLLSPLWLAALLLWWLLRRRAAPRSATMAG
ncbi:hypothetical protein [Ideonella sp. A 288]|uniref:hypothetical protein n=1 Tax=Ideonella sp. A 288 TaxID=1962181 RepID=UPI000B4BA898|nr:hypothetical protein [Ideonella sp. A 288]